MNGIYSMSKYAGIDLSYTSPGIALYDTETTKYQFFNWTSNKKLVSVDNFNLTLQKPWNTQEERFNNLSDWVMNIVGDCDRVWLENYAFSAKGMTFSMGENTGLLKHKMWKAGIPFEVLAIPAIKKFASGKGNANKALMQEAWIKETGIDLKKLLNQKEKDDSPSGDIIDAFWILKFGMSTLK